MPKRIGLLIAISLAEDLLHTGAFMTTSKLIDNNRRSHAAKVLAQASKKSQAHENHETLDHAGDNNSAESADTTSAMKDVMSTLNEQYGVIREDILKLREDLAHGYDLIKDMVDTKLNIKSLLRLVK